MERWASIMHARWAPNANSMSCIAARYHVLELGNARHVVAVSAASIRHKDIEEPELRTEVRARQALVSLQYPPQLEAIPNISVPYIPRYCDPSCPPPLLQGYRSLTWSDQKSSTGFSIFIIYNTIKC